MGANRWLRELRKDYEESNEKRFVERLAGWRGSADRTVLTYLLLKEMRALRRTIESDRRKERSR